MTLNPNTLMHMHCSSAYKLRSYPKSIKQRGGVKLIPVMLLALVAASAGVWFGQWQSANTQESTEEAVQKSLSNTLLLPEDFRAIPKFSLLNQDSQEITQADLQGKWSLIFFGFTFCPDVCPITLNVVRESLELLASEHPGTDPFEVIFVSVDPKRDTPEVLNRYIRHFSDDFSGVTGELADILEFARELSIVVSFNANEENAEDYTVDHTVSMLLVDPELRVRGKFNPPHEPDTIAADYHILREYLKDS